MWPAAIAAVAALAACGCGRQQAAPNVPGATGRAPEASSGPRQLIIFHAASLARPFADLEEVFEREHPGVDVVRESGASVGEARKITELGRKCDVYAAADYTVVDELLIPKYADFNLIFLRERIVIAYTQRSKYASEINGDNWYEILLRPDVKVGYANPLQAPVGWRTLLVWKLADLYYRDKLGGKSLYEALLEKIPEKHVVPDVGALQPLLESLELDYAFMYRATAMQHNLQWVKLPDQIDLGSEKYADFYAEAVVEVPDKAGKKKLRRGAPCLYGMTIVRGAEHPDLAVEWIKLVLSDEGQSVLKRSFLEPVNPPLCERIDLLPAELRDLARPFKGKAGGPRGG